MFGAKALLASQPFYRDVLKHNLIELLFTLAVFKLPPALAGGKGKTTLSPFRTLVHFLGLLCTGLRPSLLASQPFYWDVLKHNLIELLFTLAIFKLPHALVGGNGKATLSSPDFSPLLCLPYSELKPYLRRSLFIGMC